MSHKLSLHYCSEQPGVRVLNNSPPHELENYVVSEQASGRMSAAERARKASSAERANEWSVRANDN